MMSIPYFAKENPADFSCAPVCLRMAAAYFGKFPDMEELYRLTEAIGPRHYVLPWGMLLAVESLGLHAAYTSRNPDGLNATSITDVCACTDRSEEEVKQIAEEQLRRSRSDRCTWNDEFKSRPERAMNDGQIVVIPTLWWDSQPHNVVLVDLTDRSVMFHCPNDGRDQVWRVEKFFERWIHECTDNDLLLISDKPIRT